MRIPQRGLRRQLILAATATTLAGAAGLVAVTAAHAAAGCRVAYTISSQWSGGFGATVDVVNLGDPINGWQLTWSFTAGQTVTQLWNGTVGQSGADVTVRDAGWNGSLGTGQAATVGFNGKWNIANPVPERFALNGVACTGGITDPSSPAPSSPPSSPSTPPSTPPSSPSAPPSSPSAPPSWSPTPSASVPADEDTATFIPDPSWNCGMPDGIVAPTRGRLALRLAMPRTAVHDVGQTQYGNRSITRLQAGTFTGERASGTVLTGGLDLRLTLSDGSTQTEDLTMLRGSDGTVIYLRACGVGMPGASTVRIVPDFEAPNSSAFAWLNTGRFVGTRTVNTAANTIELEIYDVSGVAVGDSKIDIRYPAGTPRQPWDCATATGTRGASVFTESVTLGSSLSVGASKRGTRNVIPITGGTFSGRISGSVLPGGADYQLIGASAQLDARYVLSTSDREIILVRNCGPMGKLIPIFETRSAGSAGFLNANTWLSSDPSMAAGGVSITFYERR